MIIVSIWIIIISLLFYILGYKSDILQFHSTGLNDLGYILLSLIGFLIANVLVLIVLLIDLKNLIYKYRKVIFTKKILLIVLIITLIIGVVTYVIYKQYIVLTKIKVEDNIPTLLDFKHELESRDLLENNARNEKIYGIKKGKNNVVELEFGKDNNEQYPMYIYVGFVSSNNTSWIIYYVNGTIYAVTGHYYQYSDNDYVNTWDSYYDIEGGTLDDHKKRILSENEEVTVYNVEKNYYDKGKYIKSSNNFIYIVKNNSKKNIYVAIPQIASRDKYEFAKIEIVNQVNRKTINKYCNNLSEKSKFESTINDYFNKKALE